MEGECVFERSRATMARSNVVESCSRSRVAFLKYLWRGIHKRCKVEKHVFFCDAERLG